MKKGGIGGANTNKTGLKFEKETDFSEIVGSLENYSIEPIRYGNSTTLGFNVKNNENKIIGKIMSQYRFYDFLKEEGLDNSNSKKWKPDEAFINYENRTVYIIEKKWQETEGSVDEKLLGFGNKRRLYQRLLDQAERPFAVQFVFCGNSSWWNKDKYRDIYEMLRGDGIKIMLDEYEMGFFGLY